MNTIPGKLLNLIILIASTALLIIRFPYLSRGGTLDLSGMTLTLCDDFDGDALDTSLWGDFPDGLRRGGYWSHEQALVENGNLIIRTEYKTDGCYGPGYYTAGIRTKGHFDQCYGYYECRCILPAAKGLWSAFWLMGEGVNQVSKTGENGTEIDIFESPFYHLGSHFRNKITSNLHYSGYELETKYSNIGIFSIKGDPYKEYNTYGLLWTEDEYILYINGIETGRSSYGGVSKAPEWLKLSAEVDGSEGEPNLGWSGRIDRNEEGKLPADFIVDYVKVYQFDRYLDNEQDNASFSDPA